MAIELRQQLKLSQQLIMTPQLQMAIKLLQLSKQELLEMVSQELEENPALEGETEETPAEEARMEETESQPEDPSPDREVTIEEKIQEDIDWSNYFQDIGPSGRVSHEIEAKETPSVDSFTAQKESLNDHLRWQLLMTALSPEEETIGSLIIGNLNPNGYLETTVEELAELSGATPEKVETALSIIQDFDPIGVGARDLGECLRIQAKHFGLDDTIVIRIIDEHLDHVQSKNHKAIGKALKISAEEVDAAVNVIKGLEPKPGRAISDDEVQYIEPDIYVYEFDNDFVILVNDDGLPKLRINNFYRNAIKQGGLISPNAKEYIQDKMRSAAWLIRSIQQRQKTIERVMESILKFQREFFEKGIEHLKPMVLRDVAQDIDKHESTISRVTNNKYAHTPQGIFELKFFFNSSINRVYGESIASASVQQKIKKIINSEDATRPHSDLKIAEILEAQNINIARRTVAKYREMMKVLPSSKRRQV